MSLLPYYNDIQRHFAMMDRRLFHPEDMFHYPFGSMMPRDYFSFSPMDFYRPWDNFFKPMDQLTSSMNQMEIKDVGSSITADKEKFQVNVDVQHFAPSEISVKIVDGQVVIEGKHEERKDEHGYVSRQFVRKYVLPKSCLPDMVTSSLSSDGILTVTAPTVLPLPSVGEKIIPITQTGPVQKQISNNNKEVTEETK